MAKNKLVNSVLSVCSGSVGFIVFQKNGYIRIKSNQLKKLRYVKNNS